MSVSKKKIQSFTDLIAWKEGHSLVTNTYSLTSKFPRTEDYALTSQIRRCIVSVTSNIAEGFSRQSRKEKIHFYYTALGSLSEFQNQLLVARDVNYCSQTDFSRLAEQTVQVSKLINGLIKALRSHA